MENRASQLHIPQQVNRYARACLTALSARGLGMLLSLGGAFGLSYYYEYRPTHDIDAWWEEGISVEARETVILCLEDALRPYGQVRTRNWGDVFSVELIPAGDSKVDFSFQIAHRSARLEEPLPAPWPEGTQVDAFHDLMASKMVALVERGAPRDFRDIYTFCQARLITSRECWGLWRERQNLAGSDSDANRARLAVQTHLKRIANHRPLEKIYQPEEREAATRLRKWFGEDFINAILD